MMEAVSLNVIISVMIISGRQLTGNCHGFRDCGNCCSGTPAHVRQQRNSNAMALQVGEAENLPEL